MPIPAPDALRYRLWAHTRHHREAVDRSVRALRSLRGHSAAVFTSWGKDSTVVCSLVLDYLADPLLVHMTSCGELPGSETLREWCERRGARVEIIPNDLDAVIGWLHEIGLEHERDNVRAGVARKVGKLSAWMVESGLDVQVIGLRGQESRGRQWNFLSRGLIYRTANGITTCCPIAHWRVEDVWAYIVEHNLPYNERVYDSETHGLTRETIRNTGWLSTLSAQRGRVAWLRAHFPAEYRQLVEQFPQVAAMSR